MTAQDLTNFYADYIACLNARKWDSLGSYVGDEVEHNGRRIGLAGYRLMLENDVINIPDLRYVIEILVCESPHIASRLGFRCTPNRQFLGLDVNGRTVSFAENVFYEIRDAKIVRVWSVLDKAAIEAQLSGPRPA